MRHFFCDFFEYYPNHWIPVLEITWGGDFKALREAVSKRESSFKDNFIYAYLLYHEKIPAEAIHHASKTVDDYIRIAKLQMTNKEKQKYLPYCDLIFLEIAMHATLVTENSPTLENLLTSIKKNKTLEDFGLYYKEVVNILANKIRPSVILQEEIQKCFRLNLMDLWSKIESEAPGKFSFYHAKWIFLPEAKSSKAQQQMLADIISSGSEPFLGLVSQISKPLVDKLTIKDVEFLLSLAIHFLKMAEKKSPAAEAFVESAFTSVNALLYQADIVVDFFRNKNIKDLDDAEMMLTKDNKTITDQNEGYAFLIKAFMAKNYHSMLEMACWIFLRNKENEFVAKFLESSAEGWLSIFLKRHGVVDDPDKISLQDIEKNIPPQNINVLVGALYAFISLEQKGVLVKALCNILKEKIKARYPQNEIECNDAASCSVQENLVDNTVKDSEEHRRKKTEIKALRKAAKILAAQEAEEKERQKQAEEAAEAAAKELKAQAEEQKKIERKKLKAEEKKAKKEANRAIKRALQAEESEKQKMQQSIERDPIERLKIQETYEESLQSNKFYYPASSPTFFSPIILAQPMPEEDFAFIQSLRTLLLDKNYETFYQQVHQYSIWINEHFYGRKLYDIACGLSDGEAIKKLCTAGVSYQNHASARYSDLLIEYREQGRYQDYNFLCSALALDSSLSPVTL